MLENNGVDDLFGFKKAHASSVEDLVWMGDALEVGDPAYCGYFCGLEVVCAWLLAVVYLWMGC